MCYVNACDYPRGCTDTVRESAPRVDSWKKIPCRTRESNQSQRLNGRMLYQLNSVCVCVCVCFLLLSDLNHHLLYNV